jgi:AcrR family transcriptional regulator
LIAAATNVFARVGVAGASVEAVLQEAELSRRTFYKHFADLSELLAAVHDAAGRFAMRWVDEALAREERPSEKLRTGIRSLLALVAENSGLARVLFGDMRDAGPRFDARQDRIRAHFAGVLEATLAEAHARGELKRAPDPISVIALVAGIETVGAKMAAPGGPGLDEATEAMVRLARGACF